MHIGPYDNEPETIEKMKNYAREQGYEPDFLREDSTMRFISQVSVLQKQR